MSESTILGFMFGFMTAFVFYPYWRKLFLWIMKDRTKKEKGSEW